MKEEHAHDSIKRKLEAHAFFRHMEPKALTTLLPYLKEEKWPRNTCNISSKTTLDKFNIIIKGRLKIFRINSGNGREFTLFLLSHVPQKRS